MRVGMPAVAAFTAQGAGGIGAGPVLLGRFAAGRASETGRASEGRFNHGLL